MTKTSATIAIARYHSPDGRPTCSRDVQTGDVCEFLGSRNFGIVNVCMLGEQTDLLLSPDGWIQPHKKCKVWSTK